jgi:hypothetical protein
MGGRDVISSHEGSPLIERSYNSRVIPYRVENLSLKSQWCQHKLSCCKSNMPLRSSGPKTRRILMGPFSYTIIIHHRLITTKNKKHNKIKNWWQQMAEFDFCLCACKQIFCMGHGMHAQPSVSDRYICMPCHANLYFHRYTPAIVHPSLRESHTTPSIPPHPHSTQRVHGNLAN